MDYGDQLVDQESEYYDEEEASFGSVSSSKTVSV